MIIVFLAADYVVDSCNVQLPHGRLLFVERQLERINGPTDGK
ncbi:MAG: hypothetical protein AAFO94_07940 [Bacteroidota bacterium]